MEVEKIVSDLKKCNLEELHAINRFVELQINVLNLTRMLKEAEKNIIYFNGRS